MRIGVGMAALAAVIWGSQRAAEGASVGYLNTQALILIGLGPLCVAIISYEWREVVAYFASVLKALGFVETKHLRDLRQETLALANAFRDGNQMQAASLVERSKLPMLRLGGVLLLKRYDRATLAETFSSAAELSLARVRRAEDFFLTLSRASPAFGLIGTILGFIDLLRHLKNADSLGPGMAMALTATLYGIATSYCVYHPLGKTVGAYGRKLAEAWLLCEQALLLVHDGKSGPDIAVLFGDNTVKSPKLQSTGTKAA